MADDDDLYLRQQLTAPILPRFGGSASPDIVPWGTAINSEPQLLGIEPQWDQDLGRSLVPGSANRLYLRSRNAGTSAVGARLFLGAAPPSLPCWPDQLVPVPTGDGKPFASVSVAGGAVGVPADGYVYTPGTPGDALAAWVYTAQHPIQPPNDLRDVNALKQFLESTPGYAQRSVADGIDREYRYAAEYQQRDVAAQMALILTWEQCPIGWTLSLLSKSGDGPLQIQPFVLTNPSQMIWLQTTVPANYADTLTLLIDTGGKPPDPRASVDLNLSLVIDSSRTGHALQGLDRHQPFAFDSQAPALFRLGGHTWRAQSPRPPTAAMFDQSAMLHQNPSLDQNH
jgi:hypothetical protein